MRRRASFLLSLVLAGSAAAQTRVAVPAEAGLSLPAVSIGAAPSALSPLTAIPLSASSLLATPVAAPALSVAPAASLPQAPAL